MDEELKSKLVEYMDAIASKVGESATAVSAELPEVAREYIAWQFYGGLLVCICAVAFFALASVLAYFFVRHVRKVDGEVEAEITSIFSAFVLSVIGIACMGISVTQAGICIKTVVAPRIVIIDYIKDLTK